MTKNEFLDGLRTALTGEIPDAEVANNISFYDEYIKSKSIDNTEHVVMDQLGDPRLIAKTIVETYQISHGPVYKGARHDRAYQDVHTTDDSSHENQQNTYRSESNKDGRNYNFGFHSTLTWYQKLLMIIIAMVFIVLLVIIGGILIQVFFSIGLPLLIVYFVYKMIKNSTRR